MLGLALLAVVGLAVFSTLYMAGDAGYTDKFQTRNVVVSVQPPKDMNAATATTEWVSLKGYESATILIHTGAWAAGTAAVTLNEAPLVSGVGTQALAFSYMYTNDAAVTSPILVKTAVASDTFNLDTANALYQIEVKADELTDGYDCLNIAVASPGANADLYGITIIMHGPRYPSAPADMVNPVAD